jgi:cytochrome P450
VVEAWVCTSRSVAGTVLRDETRYGLAPWTDDADDVADADTVLLRHNWLEFVDHAAHRDARRRVTSAIAATMATAWVEVAREIDTLTSQVAGGPVDLVEACVEPLWQLVLSSWFGFDHDLVTSVRDSLWAVSALVVGLADREAERTAAALFGLVTDAVAAARSAPDAARGLLRELSTQDQESTPDRVVAASLLNLASDTSPLAPAAMLCVHGLLTDLAMPWHAAENTARHAVEELMRRDPVQVWTLRFVRSDHVLAGRSIREDDRILVVLGAANHDGAPDGADQSLAFGTGRHSCVGRRFAVAVVARFVAGLLRSPRLSLAAPATWANDLGIRRLTGLPVTFSTTKG